MNKRPIFSILIFLSISFYFTVLSAQAPDQAVEKSIAISSIPEGTKLNIDGKIDETFWASVEPVSDFVMRVPVVGNAPTERTEVKIAFDKENIYMAVTLYDSNPSGIKAFQKSIDADVDIEDSFTWFFDTYYDKRNAYLFAITPLGVKTDGLVSAGQGSSVNLNWDGIWDLSTNITAEGWVAEIKIPLRTLNFDPNNDKWGINFRRIIRRKNEEAYWTGHKLNQNINRPQDGGKLTGISGVSQGLGLEAVPYSTVRNT
ncbi:MAG: carbohydrate binding family 9 domain-containing protein, partial [Saprospiraceae bacterium]|nr:carbohydrate binding family 9 domain-containing protein [Saprospiraceae bacterium]